MLVSKAPKSSIPKLKMYEVRGRRTGTQRIKEIKKMSKQKTETEYIITVKDIRFRAQGQEQAENIAPNVVKDIGENEEYEVKKATTKSKCPLCNKFVFLKKDYLCELKLWNTPLVQGGSPPPKEGHTVFYHFECLSTQIRK